jgi:hypothetical protein
MDEPLCGLQDNEIIIFYQFLSKGLDFKAPHSMKLVDNGRPHQP